MTRTRDRVDLPNHDDETIIVPSYDIFDNFATLDDCLGSRQGSTNEISTKWAGSVQHLFRRTRGVLPARSEVGSRDV